MMNKQRIAVILFVISILLLVANLVVNKLTRSTEKNNNRISVDKINKDFETVIEDFDINEDWVKRIKPGKAISDSVSFIYQIKVPADLPITVILNEMNRKFFNSPFDLSSKENEMNRNALFKISYNQKELLQAVFQSDKNLFRNKPSFGFLVSNTDILNDEEFRELMIFPEKFSLILEPSKKSENLQKQITENGKEFVVILNEKINEMNYKIKEGYNPGRLRLTIRNILTSFYNAKSYMYDCSDGYSIKLYNFVKQEFDKRKLNLIPLNSFTYLMKNEKQETGERLRDICSEQNTNKVFVINASDFLNIRNDIELLRKKGYKFLSPSVINYGL